jgi:uncharacterized membrane protein YfcA
VVVAIVLGLLIGITLGALGGGGSILAVPTLVYAAGLAPSEATAVSLVAVGAAAAVGAVKHTQAGRVRWGSAAAFVATGIPGAWLGTQLNHRLDGDVLLLGFSVLIVVAAHRMLTACPSCTNVGEELAIGARPVAPPTDGSVAGTSGPTVLTRRPLAAARATVGRLDRRTVARVLLAGTAVGFLTGLFGVGGGFVIVPALTLALGLSMPAAIGTSLVIIVGNAAVALAMRGTGSIDWAVAAPFTATMLVGSAVGSQLAHRIPVELALRAFAALLVVVAIANGVLAAVALAS